MRERRPAAAAAFGFSAGCLLGGSLSADVGLVALLFLAAVALGGRCALTIAWTAAGVFAMSAVSSRSREPLWLSDGRPVTAVVRLRSDWTGGPSDWSARARAIRIRAARRVALWDGDLTLVVSGERPRPVSKLRVRGILGRSLPARNGGRLRQGSWKISIKSHRLIGEERHRAADAVLRWRRRIEERIAALVEARDARALALALVLGDRSALPLSWAPVLGRLGLGHVLAVSGMHAAVVATVVGWALVRGTRRAPWVVVPAVGAYALIAGGRASVLRAVIMLAVGVAGRRLGRAIPLANALGLAVLALLVVEPARIVDLGFGLSVLATGGVVAGSSLSPAARGTERAIRVSICAWLATLPIVCESFHQLPLAGIALNLVVVPWAVAALVAALALVALGGLPGGVGPLLAGLLELLARLPAGLVALPPWPLLAVPVPGILSPAPLLAAVSGGLVLARRRVAALVGVAALCLTLRPIEGDTELVAFDVGQGDAALVRGPRGAVLVDAGGWPRGDIASRVVVPALAQLGLRRLHAVLVTHSDLDHCGGAEVLARIVPVDELWLGPGWGAESCVARLARSFAGRVRLLWAGDRWRWGDWSFEAISPRPGSRRSANERSLVVRAESAGFSILFAGDAGRVSEAQWLEAKSVSRSTVLKVGHHGSRFSTGTELLTALSPRWAVISVGGGNVYGHPSRETLARLRAARASVLRTDRHGRVRLRPLGSGAVRARVEAGDPGDPGEVRASR